MCHSDVEADIQYGIDFLAIQGDLYWDLAAKRLDRSCSYLTNESGGTNFWIHHFDCLIFLVVLGEEKMAVVMEIDGDWPGMEKN